MKLLFLPGSYTAPSARFRIWQFVKPLQELGHEVQVRVIKPERHWSSPCRARFCQQHHNKIGSLARLLSALWLTRDVHKFDIIFMNRDVVPETKVSFLEPWLAKRNPHLIFDFDDAIHLGSREHKLRKIIPFFAWITPGNEYLASFVRQLHHHISVWPTVVDTQYYQPVEKRTSRPLCIGWSGSYSSMCHCLPVLREALIQLSNLEDFEFLVIADRRPSFDWPGVKLRFIPWSPVSEAEDLRQIDIGVMPLKDDPFQRGKCGCKALLYMATGIPALVSPVGVNSEIVVHGENGFHCTNNQDWVVYLQRLLHDEALRKRMGHSARNRVVNHYSVQALLPHMIEVFEAVASHKYGQD